VFAQSDTLARQRVAIQDCSVLKRHPTRRSDKRIGLGKSSRAIMRSSVETETPINDAVCFLFWTGSAPLAIAS
jgi:hypothetical protein